LDIPGMQKIPWSTIAVGSLLLIDRLKEEGVRIDAKRQNESYGRFAWIYDPDGNKIELWQPAAKP
jgi:hypothetical protein